MIEMSPAVMYLLIATVIFLMGMVFGMRVVLGRLRG